ncbi:MAG: tetratricopeptide repeat protein [Bacteroidales bacterium]
MEKVLLLCLIFWIPHLNGQENNVSTDYSAAHRLLLNHQFSSCEKFIRDADLTDVEEVYLSSLSGFMQLHLQGQKADFQNFTDDTRKRLKAIENRQDKEAQFTQAVVLLQSSVSHARFEQYFTAVFKFKKAYKLTHLLIQKHPEYMPAKMLYGTMLVLFGSIPDNFEWMLNLLNIEGQTQKGLNILEDVFHHQYHKEDSKYKEESLMLLTFAYCKFKPESSRLNDVFQHYHQPEIDKLITSSPVIRYNAVDLAKKTANNEQALAYMRRTYPEHPEIPFYYLDYYMKGLSLLQKLDFKAKRYFEAYIDQYPGEIYKKAAVQKIAWIALLEDSKNAYRKAFDRINDFSFNAQGSDGAAQKEFDNKDIPNTYLLKVRLLFDGGYYEKALKELMSHNPSHIYSSEEDRMEFIYRLGRIHHKLKDYPKAISYYKMTVDLGKEKKYYFAANAALQMGIIYTEQNKHKKARQVLKQCLDMNPDSYKSGIHRKAKACLKEIPVK